MDMKNKALNWILCLAIAGSLIGCGALKGRGGPEEEGGGGPEAAEAGKVDGKNNGAQLSNKEKAALQNEFDQIQNDLGVVNGDAQAAPAPAVALNDARGNLIGRENLQAVAFAPPKPLPPIDAFSGAQRLPASRLDTHSENRI